MKTTVLMLTLASGIFLLASCEKDECQSNSGCASWQECGGKKCLDKPTNNTDKPTNNNTDSGVTQPEAKKPRGEKVNQCHCDNTILPPDPIVPDERCESGWGVLMPCEQCCQYDNSGNCINRAWEKACM